MLRFCLSLVLLGGLSVSLSAQTDPRAAFLEKAGWDALAAGRTSTAADAFREALAIDANNARLQLGAGTAAFLERRDRDAREALARALAIDATLVRARALLGLVYRRTGDLPGAVLTYERLVVDAPDDKEAASTLERWRRELELHNRMQLAVGAHFLVSFEGPAEAALAEEALASLDRAYWRIGETLGTYPAVPIPVVLYSREQFHDITRSPSWAAGAYDGTIRIPMRGALENPRELDRVLAHEFTHALVRSLATRGVPTWLNEGLASALESDDLGWAEPQLGAQAPALRTLQSGFGRLGGDAARRAYATSALAARRLLEDAGGFAIANLLRDLGEGVAFDAAFLHRIQRRFDEFQAGL